MTGRRLWIISELFYPEQTSTGYFLSEIARGLASDHDVQVICAQPTYSERGIKAPSREDWDGVKINRMWGSRFDKDRLLLRLVNVVTFTMTCMLFALSHIRRGDRVLVVTNPPTLFPFVGLVARIKRAQTMLLVHDVYPDVLSVTGHMRKESFAYRLMDKFMRWACRQFDRIIVLGRDMQALLYTKSGFPLEQIPIIPNWGDTELVKPVDRPQNAFAADHGMGDAFTVQFSGNIGRTHDVETLLSAAKSTADRPDIQYWFIGYGGKAAELQGRDAQELANVFVLPRQPREVLGEMLASADVLVIAFVPGMKGLSVPSRMYNVMAAGTAIIAMTEPGSELAQVVEETGCGWVIPPYDDAALKELILSLATPEGRVERAEKGVAARRAACERYRLDNVLDAYRNVLATLRQD
ncbi:MAG: hypothetical protein CMP77_16945 [Flavobacterium sp.]|nr:hypothetical protein [Flavobacterium sp.]